MSTIDTKLKKQDYDEDKFQNLMLYVADAMGDSDSYGATMLNKVLFFSDFFHYAEHGVAITGADYMHQNFGPVPRRLVPARDDLVNSKKAIIRETPIGPYTQRRLEPLIAPDLSKFSATEIKQVDEVIRLLRGQTAGRVSDMTHNMICWKIVSDGETIPYETVFLTKTAISDNDRATAESLKTLAASVA